MSEPLGAFTLWQPWAWLISRGWEDGSRPSAYFQEYGGPTEPKLIENRKAALASGRVRAVCIHAGLTVDGDADMGLTTAGFSTPEEYARGMIESVVVLTGRVFRSRDEVPPGQRFWWTGPLAIEIGRVAPLKKLIPCRGARGLWRLPPDVEARVRAQVDVEALVAGGAP